MHPPLPRRQRARLPLTATLLLQSHGFQVARYISLERIVEQSKDQYYRALAESSEGWHEGRSAVVPWWNYFLDVPRRAVLAQVEQFTLGDLAAQAPVASPQLIKKVLAEMKERGNVRLSGRGRGARWEVVS